MADFLRADRRQLDVLLDLSLGSSSDLDTAHLRVHTRRRRRRAYTPVTRSDLMVAESGAWSPRHMRYIKTHQRHKLLARPLRYLFLAQELPPPAGVPGSHAVYCLEFLGDGRYLAAASADCSIRVYRTITSLLDRLEYQQQYDKWYAPVFHDTPVHVFTGHTGEVTLLSWLHNGFLLLASLDSTVRLWHAERAEPLGVFLHDDIVLTVAFHPLDDRFFVSGSLDCQVRLWLVLEHLVAFNRVLDTFVTAATFTPTGDSIVVGLFDGHVHLLDTVGLENTKPPLAIPGVEKKITGLQCHRHGSDTMCVVLLNLSVVSVVDLSTRELLAEFKGAPNTSLQTMALLTPPYDMVVSGLEDHRAYLWTYAPDRRHAVSLDPDSASSGVPSLPRLFKRPARSTSLVLHSYSCKFRAGRHSIGAAVMAPPSTVQFLRGSDDPVYELARLGDSGLRHDVFLVAGDTTGTIRVFRQDVAHDERKKILEKGKRCEIAAAALLVKLPMLKPTSTSTRLRASLIVAQPSQLRSSLVLDLSDVSSSTPLEALSYDRKTLFPR